MEELFASGRLVDVALAAVVVEVIVLSLRKRGLALADILGQLAAGALLLLALRCVATGADYRWALVLMTASLPAHVYDLLRRERAAKAKGAAK
ncbi:MAG: hypothetical protein JST00_06025 [Deltaproteobacteria bacterium]|nr:hypothetical protein [Deltaproteobacteria bacterium]